VKRILAIVLIAALAWIFLYNLYPTNFFNQSLNSIIASNNEETISTTTTITAIKHNTAYLKLPAVDEEGNGVVTFLKVEIVPGNGKVLTDINNLFFWVDTQNSIRTAQRVAQNITGVDLSKYDLTYSIETNASLIGGPSAGAALTIATIAVVQNKTPNENVMITGTINPDGSIGPIGEVLAKAKAAKDIGAKTFLVPAGQATQNFYKPIQDCRTIGSYRYCTIEYQQESIDINKDAAINVKEVSNIKDALQYFFSS
jgi:uncharacterized protein